MKRRVKNLLKSCWRATFPLRRPILVKTEGFLRRCMGTAANNEQAVVLDLVVRELVRLQDEVEALRRSIDDLRDGHAGLNVLRHAEERRAG